MGEDDSVAIRPDVDTAQLLKRYAQRGDESGRRVLMVSVRRERGGCTSMERFSISHLDTLEGESIHVLREVVAQFERPVLLYSVGKDSSVLVRLAQKAFAPGPIPFPLLHVDTSFKFAEMYEFRDRIVREIGARLIVHRNEIAIESGTNPGRLGTDRCCGLLKTTALLAALRDGGFDAAIGGARRDEERSRAKERIYSLRDEHGQWDPRRQRPEVWSFCNGRLIAGDSMRVFPLSNWSELDVWRYIGREAIPVSPLYFARQRQVVDNNGIMVIDPIVSAAVGGSAPAVMTRFRTLGCAPCTGAIESTAASVGAIIEELESMDVSERAHRVIDHGSDGAMEQKKQEGYF